MVICDNVRTATVTLFRLKELWFEVLLKELYVWFHMCSVLQFLFLEWKHRNQKKLYPAQIHCKKDVWIKLSGSLQIPIQKMIILLLQIH